MKRTGILLAVLSSLILATTGCVAAEPPAFDRWFLDETLRIDYFHTGNSDEEIVSLDQMWRQGIWAGSRTRLLDNLD
jgi:peptidase M64-like protein